MFSFFIDYIFLKRKTCATLIFVPANATSYKSEFAYVGAI